MRQLASKIVQLLRCFYTEFTCEGNLGQGERAYDANGCGPLHNATEPRTAVVHLAE